jgi:hypothetical protein
VDPRSGISFQKRIRPVLLHPPQPTWRRIRTFVVAVLERGVRVRTRLELHYESGVVRFYKLTTRCLHVSSNTFTNAPRVHSGFRERGRRKITRSLPDGHPEVPRDGRLQPGCRRGGTARRQGPDCGRSRHRSPSPLLQNTFVVSAGKVSLVSAWADTIYTIRKKRYF